MKTRLLSILVIISLLSISCVSAPKQTVELTEIVDRQISEMQASHEKFVQLYYDKLRDDIDTLMAHVWIPQFLSNVISGQGQSSKQFRQDLDIAYKLSSLDWEQAVKINEIEDEDVKRAIEGALKRVAEEQNSTLGMVLIDFTNAVQKQINKRRQSLIAPINEQESYVLEQLRDGYADILRGTTTIKAYLAATVDLVEERDEVLNKLGVLETQKKIINTATKLSDDAVDAIGKVENIDEGIERFLETMKDINDVIKKLKKEG